MSRLAGLRGSDVTRAISSVLESGIATSMPLELLEQFAFGVSGAGERWWRESCSPRVQWVMFTVWLGCARITGPRRRSDASCGH